MSISRISSSEATLASGTTYNISHTVSSGSGRYMLVGFDDSNDVGVSGVTYDGVAMTQLVVSGLSSGKRYIYGLVNPNVTTANVTITFSGTTASYGVVADYTGVSTVGQPDDTDFDDISGAASSSLSFTTGTADCWSFAFMEADNGGVTGDTNATVLQSDSGGNRAAFDSNGTLGAVGAKTMSFLCTAGSNGGSVGVTFAPAPTADVTLNPITPTLDGSGRLFLESVNVTISAPMQTTDTENVAWTHTNKSGDTTWTNQPKS